METQTGIDIFSASFKDHAFDSYAELRETDPVMSVPLPNDQTLKLVMRYSDASAMMKDHARFGNDIANAYSEAELEALRAQFLEGMSEEQVADGDLTGHRRFSPDHPPISPAAPVLQRHSSPTGQYIGMRDRCGGTRRTAG
ncbi:MAG: hypothetical protein U0075_11680 [Thermomicrobiales bacterium]